jgi:hypothetical protein
MSKFSPTEFWESVKYYQGNRSPIDACKEENGISYAWMHHKGRNTHHYEYWQDNFDNGGQPVRMPYEDAVEMLCDFLGAGRAYMGKDFTFKKEYEWWLNRCKKPLAIHPHTQDFISWIMAQLARDESTELTLTSRYLRFIYEYLLDTDAMRGDTNG